MKQIQPDLWETDAESPFPGLTTHAYLLVRDDGNVLFYNTGHMHELDHMANLGGVAYQFLSHRDELGDSLNVMAERFGSKLGGHIAERADFVKYRTPDIFFEKRERILNNIDVIPVSGHSPGSTCFMVESPHGKRYLFTGDTLYRTKGGGWKAGFIAGYTPPQNRTLLADSLRVLRALEPDVVLSSAFGGDAGFEEVNQQQWHDRVDNAIDALLNQAR